MKYMTITAKGTNTEQLMRIRSGQAPVFTDFADAGSGVVIPMLEVADLRVGCVYSYGPEPLPGVELEGLDNLVGVGEMAMVVLMKEDRFYHEVYLQLEDIAAQVEILMSSKLPATYRETILVDYYSKERFYAIGVSFELPNWCEVNAKPKACSLEVTMWSWKVCRAMLHALLNDAFIDALESQMKVLMECHATYSTIWHMKHGADYLHAPAGLSYQALLSDLKNGG